MPLLIISHIVPTFGSKLDDIGDYALNLARHLRQENGIQSRFIVCDPKWEGPSRIDSFTVRRLRLRNEAGIWSLLGSMKEQQNAVLLHYSGYGYHKLGVPLWLYQGIKSWLAERRGKGSNDERRFTTVFHDSLTPFPKPWNKIFYLRLVQDRFIRALHRQSALSVTSNRPMQTLLDKMEPNKSLWLPVPSDHADWKVITREYNLALFQNSVRTKANMEECAPLPPAKARKPVFSSSRPLTDSSVQIRPRPA